MQSTRFGCRSFSMCDPTIWNKLPQDLRSTDTSVQFKRSLKSWLFECPYGRIDSLERLRHKVCHINGLTYLLTHLGISIITYTVRVNCKSVIICYWPLNDVWLCDSFVLLTECLPHKLRAKVGTKKQMGVTCVSFSTDDETAFLIGGESGGVFRCSTQTRGTHAGSKQANFCAHLTLLDHTLLSTFVRLSVCLSVCQTRVL